jgi:hypothetical protein
LNGFDAFISNNLGVVSSLIGVIAIAALVIAVMAYMRVLSVTRPFAWLSGQWDGDVDSLPALLQTVELNAKDVAEVRRAIDRIVEENRTHFKRIGLVRYDAFDGIAGQQSYSLCILDDNRNGYVLSNLVGRDFSRSYAIEIQKSEAPRKLGEEEGEALRLATKD